jgi:hypothetical protein
MSPCVRFLSQARRYSVGLNDSESQAGLGHRQEDGGQRRPVNRPPLSTLVPFRM